MYFIDGGESLEEQFALDQVNTQHPNAEDSEQLGDVTVEVHSTKRPHQLLLHILEKR